MRVVHKCYRVKMLSIFNVLLRVLYPNLITKCHFAKILGKRCEESKRPPDEETGSVKAKLACSVGLFVDGLSPPLFPLHCLSSACGRCFVCFVLG